MQPNMMPSQMTEEQAVAQIKARKANLDGILVFKTAENNAHREMKAAIDNTMDDLTQVFPREVVAAYLALVECKLAASNFEVDAIRRELAQADQLLAQAASPILVPGRGGVMGGGGIRQF